MILGDSHSHRTRTQALGYQGLLQIPRLKELQSQEISSFGTNRFQRVVALEVATVLLHFILGRVHLTTKKKKMVFGPEKGHYEEFSHELLNKQICKYIFCALYC